MHRETKQKQSFSRCSCSLLWFRFISGVGPRSSSLRPSQIGASIGGSGLRNADWQPIVGLWEASINGLSKAGANKSRRHGSTASSNDSTRVQEGVDRRSSWPAERSAQDARICTSFRLPILLESLYLPPPLPSLSSYVEATRSWSQGGKMTSKRHLPDFFSSRTIPETHVWFERCFVFVIRF